MNAEPRDLWDELTDLAINHPRYDREAYLFVLNGLNWSFEKLGKRRHLTGQEFSEFLVAFAREEFGEFAHFVLREWGIYSTRDFGEIVYKLIDAEKMSRQEGDSINDFNDVLDLEEALTASEFQPRALQ